MQIIKALTRIYVDDIDQAVEFYENILGMKTTDRINYESMGLKFIEVGNFLLVCGSERDLRFTRRVFATFIVDSLEKFKEVLENNGAKILRAPQPSPVGNNMIVRHSDGLAVEYIELNI